MLKSFFDWLTSTKPVSIWQLLILIFGCTCVLAYGIRELLEKSEKKEK